MKYDKYSLKGKLKQLCKVNCSQYRRMLHGATIEECNYLHTY